MPIAKLSMHSLAFPDPRLALREPSGLLAIGGDLSAARLITAYQSGIFPWFSPGEPILWWSPDPRAVLYPEQYHLSRSFKRFLRHSRFDITLNYDFKSVIAGCADRLNEGTWLTEQMQAAYLELHQRGYAHSVEVWQDEQLVGGLYGIAQGALFCGESMFSRHSNASKCALLAFCRHFSAYGGELVDCQVLNAHTAQLGAREISRERFLQQLVNLQHKILAEACWRTQIIPLQ
ncbi:leucyl/phenylalanyl-tRNA--protein transferase [Serratia microhaemolytica]|uniref:leucyl/phenylalanyl-tRNA--protein transferase n=1 Tax=Serratia microhaemolytica TaxID=2675110 RepID=UPI000FDEAA9C|nr:leucyl/phenylalanyl-tRNA--protein transferase [Serratia microhaemolytica]